MGSFPEQDVLVALRFRMVIINYPNSSENFDHQLLSKEQLKEQNEYEEYVKGATEIFSQHAPELGDIGSFTSDNQEKKPINFFFLEIPETETFPEELQPNHATTTTNTEGKDKIAIVSGTFIGPTSFRATHKLSDEQVFSLLQHFGIKAATKNVRLSRQRLILHYAQTMWKAEDFEDIECDELMYAILNFEQERISRARLLKLHQEFGAIEIDPNGVQRGPLVWILRKDATKRLGLKSNIYNELKRAKKNKLKFSILWDPEPLNTPQIHLFYECTIVKIRAKNEKQFMENSICDVRWVKEKIVDEVDFLCFHYRILEKKKRKKKREPSTKAPAKRSKPNAQK